jgi:hypothetical protein
VSNDWAKTFAEMANTPTRVIPQHGLGRMLNPLRTRRDYMAVGRPTFLVETLPEPTDEEIRAWELRQEAMRLEGARCRLLHALRSRPEPDPWDGWPLAGD